MISYDVHWINVSNESDIYTITPQYYWYLQIAIFLILLLIIIGINTLSSAVLVYMASFNLKGNTISLKEALQQCWLQRNALLSWGIFFVCAGFILSLISRIGKADRFILSAASAGWHVLVYLIMPYIILEKLSPSAAFEKSTQSFVKTAVFQVNVLFLLGLYLAPLTIPLYLAQKVMPLGYQEIFHDILFYGFIFLGLVWLIWGNAVNSILKTAYYLKINGQNDLLFLKDEDVEKIIQQ
ncbi:hypothetical protein [Legionella micdadei]|uniref:hypothetical protein n=1 Tax=Legionella micdadei TaxID=451 RepID=UPI00115FD090|nr:hypothetical protein [Legionella micdadei]